ncbi:MAG: hypothetical protein ACRYG7_00535 [Janthinobacterium lividum]
MQLVSLNTALPQNIAWQGKTVRTSIFKQPVAGPVQVHAEYLAGDGQADLCVHAGRDKACTPTRKSTGPTGSSTRPAAQLVPRAFGG